MALYPLSIFYYIFPIEWALGVFCLLHLFFGALGMYLLSFKLTKNKISSTIAALAFGFNGLTLSSLMWQNNIAALGLMPWVILSCFLAISNTRKKWLFYASIISAIQILSGAPEIILMTWLVCFIVLFGVAPSINVPITRVSFIPPLTLLLAVIFSLPQLAPFIQLLSHSHRLSGFSDSSWSISTLGNIFLPLFNTFKWHYNVYFQYNQYWTTSFYISLPALWLALLSVAFSKNLLIRFLFLTAISSIFLSYGENSFVYPILTHLIPPVKWIRFPVKFIVMFIFIISLLSAYGMTELLQHPANKLKSKLLVAFLFLTLIIIVSFSFLVASGDLNKILVTNFIERTLFLVIFAVATMLLIFLKGKTISHIAVLILVFTLYFDVNSHLPEINPSVENWVYEPGLMKDHRPPGFDKGRFFTRHDKDFSTFAVAQDYPVMDVLSKRLGLFSNMNLLEELSKLTGMFSVHLKKTYQLLNEIYVNNPPHLPDNLANFLNIKWVYSQHKQFEWSERPSPLPLITGGQSVAYADEEAILKAIFSKSFDPLKIVYIPESYRDVVGNINSSNPEIQKTRFTPHSISISVECAEPTILVIAQAFYPNWVAYVDGIKTPIIPANYAFQAIKVAPGSHTISVQYIDTRFIFSLILSLLLLVSSCWWFRK